MKLGTPDGEPVAPFASDPGQNEDLSAQEKRIFKWSSELQGQAADKEWIWKGYIAPAEITLFSASWKIGKTTLLSHFLKAVDGSKTDFLGQQVTPCRVLYISEESEHHWARRRDALLIGNHVGFVCQHFKNRPNFPQWMRFIDELCEHISKYHFDLVVVDTLAKLWPVREENDAGQVDDALGPFREITKIGAAVMLIHHTRKSGGENFVGSRGSGALPSFVDNIIEFDRNSSNQKDCKRIIRAVGRNGGDVPESLLCELRNGQYVGLGDADAEPEVRGMKKFPWEDDAMKALVNANGEWLTFNNFQEAIPEQPGGKGVRKSDLLAVLAKWTTGGEVERCGSGKGASPYLYRLVQIEEPKPTSANEGEPKK